MGGGDLFDVQNVASEIVQTVGSNMLGFTVTVIGSESDMKKASSIVLVANS